MSTEHDIRWKQRFSNLMAHTYDEARALRAVNHICQRYLVGLEEVHNLLSSKLA